MILEVSGEWLVGGSWVAIAALARIGLLATAVAVATVTQWRPARRSLAMSLASKCPHSSRSLF
jgi:hypothetical protein